MESWFAVKLGLKDERYVLEERGFEEDAKEGRGRTSEPWWTAINQAPVGILVKVNNVDQPKEAAPRITEVLFYAALDRHNTDSGLPSPPASSPVQQRAPIFRIYALPLSSDLLYKPQQSIDLDAFSVLEANEGHFLPQAFISDAVSVKRRRTEDLFSRAAEDRKVARCSAGSRVSQIISNASAQAPLRQSTSQDASQRAHSRTPSTSNQRSEHEERAQNSRSPSITAATKRPASHRNSTCEPSNKRSSLSFSQPSDAPALPASMEEKNKDALSRIVMAGMRLHGLSRRRADDPTDEYKLVYHQTFKGATFALRGQMAREGIAAFVMQDTVDRLLGIFCPRDG